MVNFSAQNDLQSERRDSPITNGIISSERILFEELQREMIETNRCDVEGKSNREMASPVLLSQRERKITHRIDIRTTTRR